MPDDVQSACLVEVIEIQVKRGYGGSNDPLRVVKQYYSKGGELLAENDPWGASPRVCSLPDERLRGT